MDNPTVSPARAAPKRSRIKLYLLIGFVAFVVFMVIAFFALQVDDDLDPEIKSLLQKVELRTDKNSDAYLYLMGIYASAEDDPIAVGQDIYASLLESINVGLSEEGFLGYQDYPEKKKLPLPSGSFFCLAWEANCIDKIFAVESRAVANLWDQHEVLMQRYSYFNKLDDYVTLLNSFSLEAPLPPYQYISKANRLIELKSIDQARQGNTGLSIQMLMDNIASLRVQMRLQDNIVGRAIFLASISSNLDVLSVLAQSSNSNYSLNIAQLSAAEKDFEIIMASEVSSVYEGYARMVSSNSQDVAVSESLTKVTFKPNMTINSVFPFYQQAIKNSRASAIDYANIIEKGENIEISESKLRNSVGSVLGSIARPNYNKYVSWFFDVDAKIKLFNATINDKDISAILNELNSPYYHNGHPAYFSDDNKSICFDGPSPDDKRYRCLRIKK